MASVGMARAVVAVRARRMVVARNFISCKSVVVDGDGLGCFAGG